METGELFTASAKARDQARREPISETDGNEPPKSSRAAGRFPSPSVHADADTDPGISYVVRIQYMQPGPVPAPIGISRVTSRVFKSKTATRSAALSPR